MEELKELDELFTDGFIDEDAYERRRKQILDEAGGVIAAPPTTSQVGAHERCDKCGDMFDEFQPPFCANCGQQTKYFARASEDVAGKRSTRVAVAEKDGFEDDMLEALLDDLATDSRGGSVRGKSKASAAASAQHSSNLARGTFAVRGDERFSERDLESSREAKLVAKKKVIATGGKPAAGGNDTWDQLQSQLKSKQANKVAAAPAAKPVKTASPAPQLERDTFAQRGDERFSERETGPRKQQQQQQPQQQATAANRAVAKPAPTAKAAGPSPAELSRGTFAASGNERFSERKQETPLARTSASRPKRTSVRQQGEPEPQQKPPPKQQLQPELPRGTFAAAGDERFSERRPKRTSLRVQGEPAGVELLRAAAAAPTDDDLDAELAALEADLGNNIGAGRPSAAPGRVQTMPSGRVYEEIQPAKPQPVQSKKKVVPVEKAKGGGPSLPEGMSWMQTPIKTEMSRNTFAHGGDERFSERKDVSLPKGTLTESPLQLCAFCHNEIVAGQKFKTALNQLWHNACFKCGVCMTPLEKGMKFFRGELDSAVCEGCKGKRRPSCGLCQGPLAKQEIVNVTGVKIHTKCFRCNICDASLVGGYVQKKKQYLCLAHVDAEPVERNWADPNDRGPGQAPSAHPVRTGPSDADRQRIAERKRREEEKAREEAERAASIARSRQVQSRAEDEHRRAQESYIQKASHMSAIQPSGSKARNDDVDEDFDDLLRDLAEDGEAPPRASQQPQRGYRSSVQQHRAAGGGDDDDDDDDDEGGADSRLSAERQFEEMDKPQWQKDREAAERASIRTQVRQQQAALDAKQGSASNNTYYDVDSDDDNDNAVTVKIDYTQQRRK